MSLIIYFLICFSVMALNHYVFKIEADHSLIAFGIVVGSVADKLSSLIAAMIVIFVNKYGVDR